MRIVLPVHHFPPRYTAGAELYTLRLARWLLANGHSAEVVCVEAIDQGPVGKLTAAHDTYQGVPVWRLSYNIMDAPERRRWDFDNPLIGRWFAEYVSKYQPDLAHFQAGYLLSAASLKAVAAAGVPMVLTLHDYWFLCPRITLQRGSGALCEKIPDDPAGCAWCQCTEQRRYSVADRYSAGLVGAVVRGTTLRKQASQIAERRASLTAAINLVDTAIAPSHYLASRYAEILPQNKLLVLRYGLDLSQYQRPKAPSGDRPLRIGFTGQMAPHKGVHLLVDAFRRLSAGGRPIELHLYGGLEARPQYVADLRARAGDDTRIMFHGRFENHQIAGILAELDVVVVPSVWYENSPLAISEAQASGTPVVTAKLGGMAELVHDQVDGFHFAPDDTEDLARVLQRIVDDPSLIDQLRRGITMPPSLDDEARSLLAIYERAIVAV